MERDFSENTQSYIFNKIPTTKVKIPTLEGIYSPLSVDKQAFLNVGMKLKNIPIICTTQYDRCFLHILKGAVKVRHMILINLNIYIENTRIRHIV